MMGGVNHGGRDVAARIPDDSVGVELGVWRGDTAALFLRTGKVRHLHLVDAWSLSAFPSLDGMVDRYAHVVGSRELEDFERFYDRLHTSVVRRFSGESVTVWRMTTAEFFEHHAPDGVDWVYIDAAHDHDSVMRDLESSHARGWRIFGDDYMNKPGVRTAVDEFVRRHGLRLELFGNNQHEIHCA